MPEISGEVQKGDVVELLDGHGRQGTVLTIWDEKRFTCQLGTSVKLIDVETDRFRIIHRDFRGGDVLSDPGVRVGDIVMWITEKHGSKTWYGKVTNVSGETAIVNWFDKDRTTKASPIARLARVQGGIKSIPNRFQRWAR